jgi:hypothetical protein
MTGESPSYGTGLPMRPYELRAGRTEIPICEEVTMPIILWLFGFPVTLALVMWLVEIVQF